MTGEIERIINAARAAHKADWHYQHCGPQETASAADVRNQAFDDLDEALAAFDAAAPSAEPKAEDVEGMVLKLSSLYCGDNGGDGGITWGDGYKAGLEAAAQIAMENADDIADGTVDTFSGGYKSASVHIEHTIRAMPVPETPKGE
jgi:hypothetical protein